MTKESSASSSSNSESELKNKRKQARGRVTCTIKRLNEAIAKEDKNFRRFEKEIEQLRMDFEIAREVHSQLYDGSEVDLESMDKWEEDLTNNVNGMEEKVEDYVKNSSNANNETPDSQKKNVLKAKQSQQKRRRQNYCPRLDKLRPRAIGQAHCDTVYVRK